MGRRRAAIATLTGSSLSTLIAATQAIVLLPLYVKAVGENSYGAWLATGEVLLWLLAFDLGLPHQMIQRAGAAHATDDSVTVAKYFATGTAVLIAIGLSISLVIIAMSGPIAGVFLKGDEASQLAFALRVATFATCLTIINYAFVGLSRAIQSTGLVNAFGVLGTVCGFIVTYVLLVQGHGLLSIATGMVVRSFFGVCGGVVFLLFSKATREIRHNLRWSRPVFDDYREHSPTLFVSGVSYALMTNSHIVIAAFVVSPQMAVVFSVTRKAAELAKAFLDMIGYSTVGGFSHAWSSESPEKRKSMHAEILAGYFALAGGAMAAYVAANQAFVTLWMGQKFYGGLALTILLAVSVTISGWSYLEITLLRSTGELKRASRVITFECIARIALMVGLGTAFGLIGIPIASVLTGVATALWSRRRLLADESHSVRVWLVRTVPFAAGTCLALIARPVTWPAVATVVLISALASFMLLAFCDDSLARYRRFFRWGTA